MRANLNGIKFRLARFSEVIKPNDWIHEHVTLSGTHSRNDSFWGYRHIFDTYRDDTKVRERLVHKTEFVVIDSETGSVKVDPDRPEKYTVFIDDNEAATHEEVLEKVFWKRRPTNVVDKHYEEKLEKYEQEVRDLSADEVLKLAEDLGLYLPPT